MPETIEHQHLLEAMAETDRNGVPRERRSRDYDVTLSPCQDKGKARKNVKAGICQWR